MSNLYLAIFGIVILLVSSLTPASKATSLLREKMVLVFDQVSSIRPFRATLQAEEISAIEQKNRQLYAQLADCRKDVNFASPSSTVRPVLSTHPRVTSVLSYSGGQWIVLSGANTHVRAGDVVVMDGVYLGMLSRVSATYSAVETVAMTSIPLLVQHEKSKAVAVLRSEKNQTIVQFSKNIADMQKDDLFLTVPDGSHAHDSYPLATVTEVKSGNSDSMTLVEVEPIAIPLIGKKVEILLSQE